jgi:sec-independent protein translocase protein TatB
MFDIGWSELLVIAVIAIVVVGPKDLPRMLRTFGKTVGKMRRMAADFQRQFNDALREAELDEVKRSVEAIGRDNPFKAAGRDIEQAVARLDSPSPVLPKSVQPPPTPASIAAAKTTTNPAEASPAAASAAPDEPSPVAAAGGRG